MHRCWHALGLFCALAVLIGAAHAQKDPKESIDVLEGVLRIHPKFHYRYYIDGFGNGQHCALFGADERLAEIGPGRRIRVRGDLRSRFYGDPGDKNAALVPTWIIYMDVSDVDPLRGE